MNKKDGSSITIKQFLIMIFVTICATILVAYMFNLIDAPQAVIKAAEEVVEAEIEEVTGIPVDIKSEEIREIVTELKCKK